MIFWSKTMKTGFNGWSNVMGFAWYMVEYMYECMLA